MKFKTSKQRFALLTFLMFSLTFFFSCKKQDKELQETKNYIPIKKANVEKNLNGLPAFLNVPGLDKRLKSHINTSNYHYFSNNGNDQLWIIGLEPGTFGFAKAKLVASLQDGQFSMIMVSYNYDTIAYQNGDFSTYTGTTSVYSQKQKKLWDLVYEKGKLTASKHTDCNSCVLIVPSDPPPGYTDWCTIYPPLCNYYGGGTDGTNDPTMMTMDPGYDAGGGGGSDYTAITYQLNDILAPGDSYTFDSFIDPNNALYFPTIVDFQDFLSANAANQTADLSTPSTDIDANNKIEHGKFNLTFVGGVDISTKLEKVGAIWNLNNVTSTEYGLTLGWSWEQSDYSQSTSGNEIIVIVDGYVKYNVIIEDFGTVYKQFYKFQLKINNQTGKITSLAKL